MEDLKKRYEDLKERMLVKAANMKTTGFVNGQTYENIVQNADEYAVRYIIAFANSIATLAQKVCDGSLKFQEFRNVNPYGNLPEVVQRELDNLIKTNGNRNVIDSVKSFVIGSYQIPSNYVPVSSDEYKKSQNLVDK